MANLTDNLRTFFVSEEDLECRSSAGTAAQKNIENIGTGLFNMQVRDLRKQAAQPVQEQKQALEVSESELKQIIREEREAVLKEWNLM